MTAHHGDSPGICALYGGVALFYLVVLQIAIGAEGFLAGVAMGLVFLSISGLADGGERS